MTTSNSGTTRYLIEEKHLSLDHRFTITDNTGNIHYKGISTFFAIGDKLLLCDENGNELIRIRQENFHLHLTYKLFIVRTPGIEHQIAFIKRTGPMWHHILEISSNNGEYKVYRTGNLTSKEYTLIKNNNVIAIITKDASATKNFYWVDILDGNGQDHVFILALVIVLSSAQRLLSSPIAMPHMNKP
ncbi:unnamed protein product [Rotaria magnacalcarata]|uniref:Uncharacterized protein n=1 Tax=Rotaria magnacalcarata TaxID=392030 RepID=A0A816BU06_9BILA|nr:unnamed protein product [Rotaria magnacalcarata]CAF1614419.1 unnamed protein product [Rotaria magnacalcarata]CAF1899472.1 unnamed protein product [Rotaria magnacalcarata]CAF3969907.1 unnamed protein product [Rotaria magnacalcarata]CAF4916896.1 unnamed protein product [Rotaria magnacalcarata]